MDIRERTPIIDATNTPGEERQEASASRITQLALGDILVFIIFAMIGMRTHKEAWTVPSVLVTAAPFAIGWLLASPFLGAFRRNVTMQPRKMAQRVLLAWLIAWPIGLLLRGLIRHEPPPLSFAIVALLTNTVFLLLWRVPFAWLVARKSR